MEIETFPDPKALSAQELEQLYAKLGTSQKVATHIGGTLSFVRDRRSGARRR
jgi:hypothetical protein